MPRPGNIFKRATNGFLDLVAGLDDGATLPVEEELANGLDVSRTTIRKVLRHGHEIGLIGTGDGGPVRRRVPRPDDYFDDDQTSTRSELIERTLIHAVLDGRLQPGVRFSETDIARMCNASTASVRGFLIDFAHFGLIKKRPRGGWTLHGFDSTYAEELAEMRMLVEMAAFDRLVRRGLRRDDERVIDDLIARHEHLLRDGQDLTALPALDREFHAWLIAQFSNRFTHNLISVIAIIFIYQYQWDRSGRYERNRVAIDEHLQVLRPLRRGEFTVARAALHHHLVTSRASMLAALAAVRPRRPRAAAVKTARAERSA